MLLNSRFFWFENVWNWGLEMGCDTKWGKGQIKESSGIPGTVRPQKMIILGPWSNETLLKISPNFFKNSDLRSVELRKSE